MSSGSSTRYQTIGPSRRRSSGSAWTVRTATSAAAPSTEDTPTVVCTQLAQKTTAPADGGSQTAAGPSPTSTTGSWRSEEAR